MKSLSLTSDKLHKELKTIAVRDDKTMNEVIAEAIEQYVKAHKS